MAFKYMEDNPLNKISLKDVAIFVGIEEELLCKEINRDLRKYKIDFTCVRYQEGLKLIEAKKLFLSDKKISCKEVAVRIKTGSRNLRKFTHKFTGLSPKEFKKKVWKDKIVPQMTK